MVWSSPFQDLGEAVRQVGDGPVVGQRLIEKVVITACLSAVGTWPGGTKWSGTCGTKGAESRSDQF